MSGSCVGNAVEVCVCVFITRACKLKKNPRVARNSLCQSCSLESPYGPNLWSSLSCVTCVRGVTAFALGPLLSRFLFLVPVVALACVLSLRRLLLLLLLQLPQAAGVAEAAAHVRVRGEQAGCRSQRRARRSRCCARRSCCCFARPRVVRHRCVPRGWPPGAGAACSWRVLLSCCTCPRPALLLCICIR